MAAGDVIGIKLQLEGQAQFTAGLDKISSALEDTKQQTSKVGEAMRQMGAGAEQGASGVQANADALRQHLIASRDARVEANLLRQANRQLSMQMTDVVTSLASGMPAWMVFIQQGGQIKDAYGGVGAAIQGVSGYLRTLMNPLTAAAAALAVVGLAVYKGAEEMSAYNQALILTGNAAGVTAGALDVMARRIDDVAGTQGKAAETLALLAGTAGITRAQIENIAAAIIQMERAGGPAVEELAKKFGELGNKPLETLIKLNQAENFLTVSVYQQVKALQDQGREAEAAGVAQDAYAKVVLQRAKELEGNLGFIERAWRSVKDSAKEAWDAMLGIGRKKSIESELDDVRKQIAREQEYARRWPNMVTRTDRQALDALRQKEAYLQEQIRLQQRSSSQQLDEAERTAAIAAWDAERNKYLSDEVKLQEEIANIQRQGKAAGVSQQDIDERIRKAQERANKGAKQDDGQSQLERLQLENLLLAEQIKLGRELTEGEKARIKLNEEIDRGKLNPSAKVDNELRYAMLQGDRMRAQIKQREDDAKAKAKADQEEEKARTKRVADLQSEYDKQNQLVQAIEDETMALTRGKKALEEEKDARELRRAQALQDRADIIESFGVQTEESTLMRRLADGIRDEINARQRLRKETEDQEARKAALKLAEEERKERERAMAEIDRELKAGEKQLQSLRDQILATDDSKAAVRDETAARLDNAAAMLQQHAAELEGVDIANTEIAKMRERADQLREEAKLRRDLTRALDDKAVRDANAKAAREAAAQWEKTVDQVGQSLADALMSGGQRAGEALKNYFRTLILQPIIRAAVDPIARTLMGALGFGGAASAAAAGTGAGAAAGGAASAASGLAGLLGSSSTIFGAGASATMAGNLAGAFGSAGSMLSGGATLQGLAMGAGAVAPILAGVMLARPMLQAAFGRKLQDTGIQGTFGGDAGFSGSQFQFLKGGWFRRDKTITSALDADTQQMLAGSFSALRDETLQMARDLGLASDAVATYTRDIKISFKSLTDEQIAQRLQQELGSVADEMARLVAGGDATAASLRQLYESVMTQRDQLETQLLQLLGDTEELRRRERAAIHESNLALYDRIVALKDEQAALAAAAAAATSAAQDALARQISASQSAANAARQAADAYAQAGTSLRQTIATLLGGSSGASAAGAYRSALAAAQGGDAAAMGNLGGLASSYADSLRARAASASEARVASARIAAELQGVATLSDTLGAQRSAQAALLDINTAALQVLQEDLQNGDLTVETLRQHTTLLQAINTALGSTGAIAAAMQSLDANVDGLLTFDELRQGLAGKATDAQISALIARADRNADAQVSLQELTAERVRSVVLGTSDIVNAANRTTATTGSVATATGGVIDEQSRAVGYLANSDVTLARVLAKLSEADPTNLLLVDRVTSGNTLVADRLSQVISAINAQTAAQQAEAKRQQDLQRAQADLKSAAGYMGSLQSQLADAQATLQGTPATVSVRVGTRYDWLGFAKGGIYEDRPNPAYQSAIDSLNAAQAALNQYAPTVEALRQQIRNLGGVPQFATGGMHAGGLRIVGERGPELEATGPARYWSAADTTAMLANGTRREELLAAEIRALRAEVQGLRAETRATAENTGKSQRLLQRVTRDGESLQVVDVTPSP